MWDMFWFGWFAGQVIVILATMYFGYKHDKKMSDPCPRIYNGYDCKGKTCDHSSRTWALMGIDKEYIYGQPTRGAWNDPLRKDET